MAAMAKLKELVHEVALHAEVLMSWVLINNNGEREAMDNGITTKEPLS